MPGRQLDERMPHYPSLADHSAGSTATPIRSIVAKEPRVMSLDMGSTVPRKIGDLARAFADHADADAEETAAMMAQVRPGLIPCPARARGFVGFAGRTSPGFAPVPSDDNGGHADTAIAAPPK